MAPETPQNAGYMLAAYIVAPVILGGYLVVLWGRVGRVIGQTDGRADGRTDGQTDRRTVG